MQLFVEKRCVAKSPLWPECKAGDFTDTLPAMLRITRRGLILSDDEQKMHLGRAVGSNASRGQARDIQWLIPSRTPAA